jgi:acetolactate synthase-1/3 small subunit
MTAGPSLHPTSHHNSVPPLPTPGGDETIPQHATESQPTSASSHTQQPESPSAALARQFEHPSQSPSSPYNLNHSEALIRKGQHFATIQALAAQFGGKTVDVSSASVIVEMTGKTERIDAFLGLVRPYGILEAVRSGTFRSCALLYLTIQSVSKLIT